MKKAKIKINTVYIIVFILFGAYALSICYTFLWGVVAGLMEDNNVFILHPFEVRFQKLRSGLYDGKIRKDIHAGNAVQQRLVHGGRDCIERGLFYDHGVRSE